MRSLGSQRWYVVDLVQTCRKKRHRAMRTRQQVFAGWKVLLAGVGGLLSASQAAAMEASCAVADSGPGLSGPSALPEDGIVRTLLAVGFIGLILWSLFRSDSVDPTNQ